MPLLLLAAGLILFRAENGVLLAWEQADDRMKLDSVCEVIHYAEAMRAHSMASYERHLGQKIRFMTETLSLDVTEEGYSGPRLFGDGAVVVFRDGKAVWPEGDPRGLSGVQRSGHPGGPAPGGGCSRRRDGRTGRGETNDLSFRVTVLSVGLNSYHI